MDIWVTSIMYIRYVNFPLSANRYYNFVLRNSRYELLLSKLFREMLVHCVHALETARQSRVPVYLKRDICRLHSVGTTLLIYNGENCES